MAYETIKLTKHSDVIQEYVAKEAITPGMLLALYTDGTIYPHPVDGGNAVPAFALEDELQGKGINENYVIGDRVQVWVPYRGDIVNALLKDDETVVIGNWLCSDGDGRVRVFTTTVGDSGEAEYAMPIVGFALETITAGAYGSGSESSEGGAYCNPRIKMMVI